MSEKTWCLVLRSGHRMPMNRYRTRYFGKPGLCVTFDWRNAVRFEDKESALFYLSNLYDKYGNQIKRWYPRKIKTAIKNHIKSRKLREVKIFDREYAKHLLRTL